MMPNRIRNIIIGSVLLAFLAGGLGVSLFLVNQKQDIRNQASTNTGTAMVTISPTSGNIPAGSSLPITISLNPAGNIISALAVRLNFSYTGSTSELTAENIQISQALTSGGDWTCPVKKFTASGGKANIDIACANINTLGYSGNGAINLATLSLTASASAANNTYTLTFDPKESIITKKSDSTDILLTPNSQGTYTVSAGVTPPPISHQYRCSGSSCILDDALGTFTSKNCDNACVRPASPPPPGPTVITPTTRTMPATGGSALTIITIVAGTLFSLVSFILLK